MAAKLDWTGASKTGTTVSGYRLLEAGAPLASVGPGVLTYTDPTAADNTAYSVVADFADGTNVASADAIYRVPVATTYGYRSTVGPKATTQPAGSVLVNPGEDLVTAYTNAGVGATLYFAAGTHRVPMTGAILTGTTLDPRATQTWIGAQGAIISGLALIASTGWTALGGNKWSKVVSTMANTPRAYNTQGSNHPNPNAVYREVIYINKQPMWRVASTAEIAGLNHYHYDYATQTLTIGVDPLGRTIEHNVPLAKSGGTAWGRLLDSSNNGITLRNLIFEGGMPDNGHGAIAANNSGASIAWTIEDCLFRCSNYGFFNVYGGEGVTHQHILRRNHFLNSGGTGIGSNYSHGMLIQDCLVEGANQSGFAHGWDRSGIKLVRSDDCIVEYTDVRDCQAVGVWFDIECRRPEVRYCRLQSNARHGIDHEIGYGGDGFGAKAAGGGFHHNLIRWSGAHGVYLNVSRETRVWENLLYDNNVNGETDRGTLTVQDQARDTTTDTASGAHRTGSVPRLGINNDFHDNIIRKPKNIPGTYQSLLLRYQLTGEPAPSPDSLTTNAFYDNDYHNVDTAGSLFKWDDTTKTWTQWQADGRDTAGSMALLTDPDGLGGGIRNTAEGFTASGTAVTAGSAGNTGGDSGTFFDAMYAGGGASITSYSGTQARPVKGGRYVYRFYQPNSGNSLGSAYLQWKERLGGAQVDSVMGADVFLRATPGANISLMDVLSDTGGTMTRRTRLDFDPSDGKIRLRNGASTAMVTSANVYPIGRWFGFDLRFIADTSVEVRLFLNPASDTPTETLTWTGLTGVDINTVRFGNIISTSPVEAFYDRMYARRTGWPIRDLR